MHIRGAKAPTEAQNPGVKNNQSTANTPGSRGQTARGRDVLLKNASPDACIEVSDQGAHTILRCRRPILERAEGVAAHPNDLNGLKPKHFLFFLFYFIEFLITNINKHRQQPIRPLNDWTGHRQVHINAADGPFARQAIGQTTRKAADNPATSRTTSSKEVKSRPEPL